MSRDIEEFARTIVDAAIKVHRALGPGLLESAYQACPAYELKKRGLQVECEVELPVSFSWRPLRLCVKKESFMGVENGFEPQILAFACNYCAYAAADLAGSMRLNYPTNVKIVQIPCSGKVDALYLLRAFERGADGVLVAG
jgi:F420-non-reducing hydrogenase iron-sulfur subunit